jgi:hypothetical protein
MPNAIPLGIASFIAGLTSAIERQAERRQAQDRDALATLVRGGGYELQPTTGAQLAPFLERLYGRTYRADPGGAPVIDTGGGGALTARPLPRFSLDNYVKTSGLTADEREELYESLRPFVGQPLNSRMAGEIGDIQRSFWKGIKDSRRATEREAAIDKRQRQHEVDVARRQLLKDIKDADAGEELVEEAKQATTMDHLVAIASKLPSALDLKIKEEERLAPLRLKAKVEEKKALAPYERQPQSRGTTAVELAVKAAGGDTQAMEALKLYKSRPGGAAGEQPDDDSDWEKLNLARLAYLAEGPVGDPVADQARRAMALLGRLKGTSARRKKGEPSERTTPQIPPLGPESPEGEKTYKGTSPPQGDLPQIKGFRKLN